MQEKVANLSDLKEGEVKGVKVGAVQVALYRIGNQVFATDDLCTHEFCVISENYEMHDMEVECTCHGSCFNIKTGENTVPPAASPLPTYRTKVENGEVFVEV